MKTIIIEEKLPNGHVSFRVYYKFLWMMTRPEHVYGIVNNFTSLADAVQAIKRDMEKARMVAKKTEKKIVAEVVSESNVKYYGEVM